MATAPTSTPPTRILDVAERLVQERGFNGFSYADVAGELGVTTAALHYHFPGKAELGEALIGAVRERASATALAALDARPARRAARSCAPTPQLYADVFRDERMCLCGMLAADYATLPDPMRARVVTFFDDNETWLGARARGRPRRRDARVPAAPRARSRGRS